jgi:hypothetical protein
MTLYSNSRADLIKYILRVPLRHYEGGVVDSGTTATLVDDELERPDDYYQNTTPVSRVKIITTTDGAAPKGEQRRISDFALSTGTITVSSDKLFSVAPGAGDTYVILNQYDWDEIADAINLVIESLGEKGMIYKIDETLETQDDTYEYSLPPGFITIHRVAQANSDGNFTDPIPPDQYTVFKGNPAKLKLLTMPVSEQHIDHYYGELWASSSLVADRRLRIEGYERQQKLTTDDSVCYLNPSYIVWKTAAMVLSSRIIANDNDAYRVRRDECAKEAEAYLKELVITQLPPNTKKIY